MSNTISNPNGFGKPWNPALHGAVAQNVRGGGFPVPRREQPPSDDPGREGGFAPAHPPAAQEEPNA